MCGGRDNASGGCSTVPQLYVAVCSLHESHSSGGTTSGIAGRSSSLLITAGRNGDCGGLIIHGRNRLLVSGYSLCACAC